MKLVEGRGVSELNSAKECAQTEAAVTVKELSTTRYCVGKVSEAKSLDPSRLQHPKLQIHLKAGGFSPGGELPPPSVFPDCRGRVPSGGELSSKCFPRRSTKMQRRLWL